MGCYIVYVCPLVRVCRHVARQQQQQQTAGSTAPASQPATAAAQPSEPSQWPSRRHLPDSRAEKPSFFKMANQRKFFVGGNWKMNGDKAAIDGIISFMKGPLNADTGKFLYREAAAPDHRLSGAKYTCRQISTPMSETVLFTALFWDISIWHSLCPSIIKSPYFVYYLARSAVNVGFQRNKLNWFFFFISLLLYIYSFTINVLR